MVLCNFGLRRLRVMVGRDRFIGTVYVDYSCIPCIEGGQGDGTGGNNEKNSGNKTDKCVISGKDPATLQEKINAAINKWTNKVLRNV